MIWGVMLSNNLLLRDMSTLTFQTDRDGESLWIHCALCNADIQPEQYWFPDMNEVFEAIASHYLDNRNVHSG